MGLTGLKKTEQQTIDDFIDGARKRNKVLEKHKTNYRRFTFSLTQEVDTDIDDLLLKCQVARATRSTIIKAAIDYLKSASDEDLQSCVRKQLK